MAKSNLQGSNINLVKLHNLQVILLTLLYELVLSRSQLAKRTNLSNTTITNLIAELIKQGIVGEKNVGGEEQEKLRPMGCLRMRICLEPNALFVIGVHIGVGTFCVAITNLRAEFLLSKVQSFNVESPTNDVLDQVVAAIGFVVVESGFDQNKILRVGVGASGLVDFLTGVNFLAPNLNWHDVPLREYLQARLPFPVIADNNIRTMAIGEIYFGAGRGYDSVAFVYSRIGAGAGLTFKGRVFRDSSKGAREIGHIDMLLQGGEPRRCGNSGCLKTLVSEPAILKQAENISRKNPAGILAKICRENIDDTPIECVFEATRQGDIRVKEMIIERAFGGMEKNVHVKATSFGWKAGVIGAAALALLIFFTNHWKINYSVEETLIPGPAMFITCPEMQRQKE